ncbi:MAG: S9 family peptidase [Saprospiraceae bacterium]|uniref:S9 family peptidase n=1 Tax=Candidatus Opimibacter skivensis TaxID=2982028 RepID=A0A9D7SR21_9BACT|nr:S9 family peptidase [Candidatus Opimibacter skivensis]
MRILLNVLLFFMAFIIRGHAQNSPLKVLDHSDFLIWKTIQDIQLSGDGHITTYRLVPGEGDPTLLIYDASDKTTQQIERASRSNIDYDGKFIYGSITPHRDSLRNLERKKIEKSKWPCDTLFIYDIQKREKVFIPYVTSFKNPAKHGDWLAYTIKKEALKVDTTINVKKSKKDIVHLIVRQLSTGMEDTLKNVKEFTWSDKSPILLATTEHVDSIHIAGVYFWKDHTWKIIKKQKGEYSRLTISGDGSKMAFLGNTDTTKTQVQPWQLYYYDFTQDTAVSIAQKNDSKLPLVSQYTDPRWSDNGRYLYYGRSVMPAIKDTSLLEDESVDVEIWRTDDPVMYTVQNVNKSIDEKRAYLSVFDTQLKNHISINNPDWEIAVFNRESNSRFVLLYTEQPYQLESSWTGVSKKDLAIVDIQTGEISPFRKGIVTQPRMSPDGKYAYGFSESDSTWWSYQVATGVFSFLNPNGLPLFYNELNDTPGYPEGYGSIGWTKDDQSLILYDRFDLWSWTPLKTKVPVRLTNGRESSLIYRYIRTDAEERNISVDSLWLLQVTNDITKSSGYIWYSPVTKVVDEATLLPFKYSMQIAKARETDIYVFQKENFATFPDLQLTKDHFKTSEKISDANPQQKNYAWGNIELCHWLDEDSVDHTGLLVKPAGYDSTRTYPTIVNFYERSSDELHNHPTPAPHRSTINYAFYASRGYVIFNPDIIYTLGTPGESAYKIVMSGVHSLIDRHIADPHNIGLQGHSWGGYQIAYIVTRTNLFKCAEAGASVVNMTSAYVGIRWGTGLSRMFQYEREQSRIGKTLWEDPQAYISNSALFNIDKVTTPILILHNDEDSAVPFEQGIEFYSALRRLGKKAWLLNYRGEPHWPVKWQNRKDFQMRMSQFFDHYLKDKPMPKWMEEGVPAVERGINRGY